ncbi:MAG: hypothetical protein AAFU68_03005 [Pseudomonadota bacterium]
MALIAFSGRIQITDANGSAVSGGKLRLFENNASTPVTTYSDAALSVPNPDPAVANAAGVITVFAASGVYRLALYDADDALLDGFPIDNVDFSGALQNNFAASAAPTTSNNASEGYSLGSRWIHSGTHYVLTSFTGTDANWETTDNSDVTLGSLNDANGNEMLVGTPTGSAVNHVGLTNAATGNAPDIAAVGDDANIDLQLSAKGTGKILIAPDLSLSKTLIQKLGADVASANDMTLGDGNAFDITGTTTINTIASKGVGTTVILQFDGALQLTHSADLVLPTAANITTAAGDIAVFYEYASGDWRCVSYQRADGSGLGSSGGLVFLASTELSSDASVDFTAFDSSTYDNYLFLFESVVPSNDGTVFAMRFKRSGQGSFDSGGSDYRYIGNTADSEINTLGGSGVGSAASEYGVSGSIWVHGAHDTSTFTRTTALLTYRNAGSAMTLDNNMCGEHEFLADIIEAQFFFATGNLESGRISMFGVVNS